MHPLPAVAMIGWHVARHWAADEGRGASLSYQDGIRGDAIEAGRHVPPQILGPGGTLWSVQPLPISAAM